MLNFSSCLTEHCIRSKSARPGDRELFFSRPKLNVSRLRRPGAVRAQPCIVMKMARPFLNGNHHVFFDNYFSSPILLDHLLDQQTYARSTVWCTRKDLPPCTKNKLRQLEETVIWQRESLLFTKWHNKRDIALILVYPHVTK